MCSEKEELNAFAKSTDPWQPAQSAWAEMDRNVSQYIMYIFACQRIILLHNSKWIFMDP